MGDFNICLWFTGGFENVGSCLIGLYNYLEVVDDYGAVLVLLFAYFIGGDFLLCGEDLYVMILFFFIIGFGWEKYKSSSPRIYLYFVRKLRPNCSICYDISSSL